MAVVFNISGNKFRLTTAGRRLNPHGAAERWVGGLETITVHDGHQQEFETHKVIQKRRAQ